MEIQKEIERIELLFQDDHTHHHLEKKMNKLIKFKVEPYIGCIVNQYYLSILGGDHLQLGLIDELEKYISSIKKNLDIIQKLDENQQLHKDIIVLLTNKLKLSNQLKDKMKQKYQEYIDISNTDNKSKLYNIVNFHKYQLDTYKLVIHKNDLSNNHTIHLHVNQLKEYKSIIDTMLEKQRKEKEDDNIYYIKLLENQIGLIEQQIELCKQ